LGPIRSSRRISIVQRSPNRSSALASPQYSSYDLFAMIATNIALKYVHTNSEVVTYEQ
jgi:hypothetical protein